MLASVQVLGALFVVGVTAVMLKLVPVPEAKLVSVPLVKVAQFPKPVKVVVFVVAVMLPVVGFTKLIVACVPRVMTCKAAVRLALPEVDSANRLLVFAVSEVLV